MRVRRLVRRLALAGQFVPFAVNVEAAEETVRSITEAGGKALSQKSDISSKADVDALVDRAVSTEPKNSGTGSAS